MDFSEKIDIISPHSENSYNTKIGILSIIAILSILWALFRPLIIGREETKQKDSVQGSIVCIKSQLYIIQDGKTILLEQNGKPIMCK